MEKKEDRVWVVYDSDSIGGVTLNPEDRWSERSPKYTTLEIKGLYKEQPKDKFYCPSLEVDPHILDCDVVFLVVVRFQTGDTFGTSHGEFHFYSVRSTEEETRVDIRDIKEAKKPGVYRPWDGYFERLEEIEVHQMPLQGSCPAKDPEMEGVKFFKHH